MNLMAAALVISGDVQGVGYRWWAVKRAQSFPIAGWVRNNFDGTVSALVEGEKRDVEAFIEALREGPSMARVRNIKITWQEYSGSYDGFDITR